MVLSPRIICFCTVGGLGICGCFVCSGGRLGVLSTVGWWIGCVVDLVCVQSFECRRVWDTLPYAILWTIWEMCNQVVFKNKECDLNVALAMINFRTAWWFKYCGKGSEEAVALLQLNLSEKMCGSFRTQKVFGGRLGPS